MTRGRRRDPFFDEVAACVASGVPWLTVARALDLPPSRVWQACATRGVRVGLVRVKRKGLT